MRLFIVRHGQTEWNVKGLAQGHTNIPLDSVGEKQALALGKRFEPMKGIRIISSDLEREQMTAHAIALATKGEVTYDQRLRERGFGDWEGRVFDDFHQQIWSCGDPFGFVPPNGESFRNVWDRVGSFADELTLKHEDLIVVTHGGTGGLLLSTLFKGTVETCRGFRFANAGVCELRRREDGWFFLHTYNCINHLAELEARQGDADGTTA